MADGGIAALIKSRNDGAGSVITEFYACNPPAYAVYRTDARVLIEFADQPDLEAAQRSALAPLGPLRSEINGLIDGWRASNDHRKLATARALDQRTADALVMALEGDGPNAILELNAVRNAIIDGRKSMARFLYLITAFAVAVLIALLVDVLSLPGVGLCTAWINVGDMLTAIIGGAAGAFFSIATGLSKRTILTDLQQRDNAMDAILRMVIGVISAGILICLLRSGVGVTLAPAASGGWMQLVTLGFLAGFSERLVPDLLEKAGMAVEVTPLPPKPPLAAAPLAEAKPLEVKPAVGVVADAPSSPESGDCLCEVPLAPADAVSDAALPAATGGVQ